MVVAGQGQGHGQPAVDSLLASTEVILDALYGIGKTRPLSGASEDVLLKAKARKDAGKGLRVFAVDIPSGLDAEWKQSVFFVQDPLGKVVSRRLKQKNYTGSIPGGPDGEYVVVRYETEFTKGKVPF